jgi:hypothetical protein
MRQEVDSSQKSVYPWIAAAGVVGILCGVSALFPEKPVSVPISAEVHRSGDVSLSLAGAPAGATSPVCGCTHSHVPGGWRGIVLPAQELMVSRETDEPEAATQFDLSSPGTQTLASLPTELGINYRVAIIAVRNRDVGVDPFRLKGSDVVGYSSERMVTDWLSIITNGPLHLRSSSVEPVAALSPPEDRAVSLAYSGDVGTPGDRELKVSTSFNVDASQHGVYGENAFPILDVLGPSVTMWAPIEDVKFPYTPTAYIDALPVSQEGQEYEFQAQEWRIDAPPPPPPGWTAELVVKTLSPMFASRLAIRPAHRHSQPSVSEDGGAGTGTVTISAPHVARNATQLTPKFKAADRDPKFWIRNLPFIPTVQTAPGQRIGASPSEITYGSGSKEFEFPPTPPLTGINVFGEISDLRFSDATADLTIGTESRRISAGTPLEFRNIKGNGIVGHHMLIPVRVDGHEAEIHVIGEADARVNGLPVASERSWIANTLSDEKVSWFLALVASLSFVNGFRLYASRNGRKEKGRRK